MSSPRDDLVYVEDMLARTRRILDKTRDVTWERFRDDQDLHDIAERSISVIREELPGLAEDLERLLADSE